MEQMRKPFQGVWNVARFNRHFYLITFAALSLIFLIGFFNETLRFYSIILFFIALGMTLFSLVITYYIYDLSDLYDFFYLNNLK